MPCNLNSLSINEFKSIPLIITFLLKAEGAEEAMKGRGGLRAKILTNGRLKKSPEG